MHGDLTLAGVELGGTKSVALLARGGDIAERHVVATTTPAATLGALHEQLAKWQRTTGFHAVGIASFGPIRVARGTSDHGRMLPTPKPGWTGANVAQTLTADLKCPWSLDTDVNAAALAEARWGAAQGDGSVCYITIGTGVGAGLLIEGHPVHGALHPEVGHMSLRRAEGDTFAGCCPFHSDCVEGLVAGPALEARFGQRGELVPDDDPKWRFVAHDVAQLVATLILTVSPEKVLIGGGIGMKRDFLLAGVRRGVVDALDCYLPHVDAETIERIVIRPGLGEDAGPMGAIALAQAALNEAARVSTKTGSIT